MAQVGWFMYQRWDEVPVGVFLTENLAKEVADAGEGEYVLVPIEANQAYENLIDEDLPGAIIYKSQGLAGRVTDLENKMDQAQTAFVNLKTEFDTFKAQAQTAVQNLNQAVNDLDARVTALEGA